MAITFTNEAVFLPSGIPEAIGSTFVGPWSNSVAGGADATAFDSPAPEVEDYDGLGIKSMRFGTGSTSKRLRWLAGKTLTRPLIVVCVYTDWTNTTSYNGVYDGLTSGARAHELYWAGNPTYTSAYAMAQVNHTERGNNGANRCSMFLSRGANSHYRLGTVRVTGNPGTGDPTGLFIGGVYNKNGCGAAISALLAATVDLDGETDNTVIEDAYVAWASDLLWPTFGSDVPGLSDPGGGGADATATLLASALTLSSGVLVPTCDAGATLQAGSLTFASNALDRTIDAIAEQLGGTLALSGSPVSVTVDAVADLGSGSLLVTGSAPLQSSASVSALLGSGMLLLAGQPIVAGSITDATAVLQASSLSLTGQPLGVSADTLAELGASLVSLSSAPLVVSSAVIAALGPGTVSFAGGVLTVNLSDVTPDRLVAAVKLTRRINARMNINRRLSARLER